MCKCTYSVRSDYRLWMDYLGEVKELVESFFLDKKEWSDCSKGLEDLVERYLGYRLYLGSGLNRVTQRDRDASYGCIRSSRLVIANGGRCLSE
jgi:hypothetical protein